MASNVDLGDVSMYGCEEERSVRDLLKRMVVKRYTHQLGCAQRARTPERGEESPLVGEVVQMCRRVAGSSCLGEPVRSPQGRMLGVGARRKGGAGQVSFDAFEIVQPESCSLLEWPAEEERGSPLGAMERDAVVVESESVGCSVHLGTSQA